MDIMDTKTIQHSTIYKLRHSIALILFALLLAGVPTNISWASCVTDEHDTTRDLIDEEHEQSGGGTTYWDGDINSDVDCAGDIDTADTEGGGLGLRVFITEQMKCQQIWLLEDFFVKFVLPAMQMMTEQLVTVGMQQTMIIGAFFDAQIQLDTQRLLQEKTAEAHKDYHPSVGMCAIGSNTKSLAASNRNATYTTHVLSQRSQDRQLSNAPFASAEGPKYDRQSRLEQYKTRYCNIKDNNYGLEELCGAGGPNEFVNKDINYTRTIDNVSTLNVDFVDTDTSDDELDVIAMANYLYSHDVFKKPSKDQLKNPKNQDEYLDMRSVIAKRSVAENSFNTIVGLKSSGTELAEETEMTMSKVMEAFEVPEDEVPFFIGERPSYYAQMEVLAQRMYQQPEFYTNLYDKPANVARKEVAMQAIELMLDRDSYKSELRTEAMLAVLLELEIDKLQSGIQDRLEDLDETDKEDE